MISADLTQEVPSESPTSAAGRGDTGSLPGPSSRTAVDSPRPGGSST